MSNEALQSDWSLKFHLADNDQLICYSKESDDRSNLILSSSISIRITPSPAS